MIQTHSSGYFAIATNTVYYGVVYLLYRAGAWTPTLTGIALLFGFGIAFDSVVSFAAYLWLLKKKRFIFDAKRISFGVFTSAAVFSDWPKFLNVFCLIGRMTAQKQTQLIENQ